MNEKLQKNQRGVLTKLLISHLLTALEYQTLLQSNAKTQYSYLVVEYEMNLIRIFTNLNETISNE